jgi:hypothetical protein
MLKRIIYALLTSLSYLPHTFATEEYIEAGQGSCVRIRKQDELTLNGETTTLLIPHVVSDGPESRNAHIADFIMPVRSTGNGDFLYDPESQSEAFNAVHAFAVADTVLTMYDRDLNFIGHAKDNKGRAFNFSSSTRFENSYTGWKARASLAIYPHDNSAENNAFFISSSPNEGELHFFPFKTPKGTTKKTVYTSGSLDIVAHETGHAALHFLRPDFGRSPQPNALNEAFGDLTAIFTILNNSVLRQDLLVETKGDLTKKSFLPLIAEQFGILLDEGAALRNAENVLTVHDLSQDISKWESHSLSRLFTGAIYDILAEAFKIELQRNRSGFADDEVLFRVANNLRRLVLLSFIEAPTDPTFFSMGLLMRQLSEKHPTFNSLQPYIERNFIKRGIRNHLKQYDNAYMKSLNSSQRNSFSPYICQALIPSPISWIESHESFSSESEEEIKDLNNRVRRLGMKEKRASKRWH